jgi:hypothetical protein
MKTNTGKKENPFKERLKKLRFVFSPYEWKSAYLFLYDAVASFADLERFILCDDVNTKIFATIEIAPLVFDLLTKEERQILGYLFQNRFEDRRRCEVGNPLPLIFQDGITTVAESARYALAQLEVFEKRLLEEKNKITQEKNL